MSTNDDRAAEQGFNDSELQDIMQEIESLEREFSGDSGADAQNLAIAADDVRKTSLQAEIDREINAGQESASEEEDFSELDQAMEEMEAEAPTNVVALGAKKVAPQIASKVAPMSFSAEGSMNLAMEFNLGETLATLQVKGEEGVTFEMDGVSFTLHPTKGCEVSMSNGVKFSVPLNAATQMKKAV